MPPKATGQKRKRGRPHNAPQGGDASAQPSAAADAEPKEISHDADDAARPLKRGRLAKSKLPDLEVEPEPERSRPADDQKPKRKGRPRRENADEDRASIDESASAQPRRKQRRTAENDGRDEEGEESPSAEKPTRGKRGRRSAKEANRAAHVEEEAEESNSATKKRSGRTSRPVEEAEPDVEPAPKKKRRRPSLNNKAVAEAPTVAPEDEATTKRRGRKPRGMVVEAERPASEEESPVMEAAPKRKRRRPADKPAEPSPEREEAAVKRDGGRPSPKSNRKAQSSSHTESKESRRQKPRHPSPAQEAPAEKPTKTQRGRASQEESLHQPPDTQRRRQRRPRASDASSQGANPDGQSVQPRKSQKRSSGDAPTQPASPPKKRRRRTSEEQQPQKHSEPASEPASRRRPAPKYRHIASRTRQIPRSTIEEKWSPLGPPSLSIISNLLRLAERPVLQRLAGNDKRRDQAASAIRLVTNRLNKKLSRGLPFPPASAPPPRAGSKRQRSEDGGRVEELNFERVVDSVTSLEKQLDPLLHAVELLKAEKERDEKALEGDYRTLSTLEANARSEARNFKDSLRKTHVLVPEQKDKGETPQGANEDDFKFVFDNSVSGTLFKDFEDDELRGLAGQLGSHMESMRNNLQQIHGVVPQIARSRAALQDVLFKHLGEQVYENVLFG